MEHAYKTYEHTGLWHVIKDAVDNMLENGDIKMIARKELVIGYLCKKIMDHTGTMTLQSFTKR